MQCDRCTVLISVESNTSEEEEEDEVIIRRAKKKIVFHSTACMPRISRCRPSHIIIGGRNEHSIYSRANYSVPIALMHSTANMERESFCHLIALELLWRFSLFLGESFFPVVHCQTSWTSLFPCRSRAFPSLFFFFHSLIYLVTTLKIEHERKLYTPCSFFPLTSRRRRRARKNWLSSDTIYALTSKQYVVNHSCTDWTWWTIREEVQCFHCSYGYLWGRTSEIDC